MRILIATGVYPPDIGGPATYSKLLFDELPKHGFEVDVLSFGEVRHIPKIIRHLFYFLKLLRVGRSFNIIYAQDPVSVGLPVCLASKILCKKFILKIVGDYAWEQQQQRKNVDFVTPEEFQGKRFDFITEIRRKIERGVAKRASKIVVPSEYLKKIVLMWGISENKIEVIYNAFEILDNSSVGYPMSHRLGDSDYNIISVGRLVPWKGFDTLIEIMPKILKEIPKAKLTIIGSGPQKKNYELRIKNYELTNSVFLVGQIPHKEVLEYLKSSDLFVLNTGYEGLSHQLLEAMALGVPIITTNVGGNPELIESSENGFLVEYNNRYQIEKAILDLYRDKDLRDRFIQNAKEKAKEFNKERMIKKIINILKI